MVPNETVLLSAAQHFILKSDKKNAGMDYLKNIAKQGDVKNETLADIKVALKDVADQAKDPMSEKQTRLAFGNDIVNIALRLYS